MKCPQCMEEGKTSKVYPGLCWVTSMYFPPFYDENGEYHSHDNNRRTTEYKCSNGHQWKEVKYGKPCPTCGMNWK